MQENFDEIKQELLDRAKEKDACATEYRRAAQAKDEAELLQVIKENLEWCSVKGICPDSFLAKFTPSVLLGAGVANSGVGNTGLANTGNCNTGDRNTGDRNTGNCNTGDWNTGYWNTGYWNTGYCNTGYCNTGAFCTGDARFPIFNKPSPWTEEQFLNSQAYRLLRQVDTKLWVPESQMTDQEKEANRGWKVAEGFVRDIPFKEAFQNKWHNWSEESRSAFKELPNYDANVFFEITGVEYK